MQRLCGGGRSGGANRGGRVQGGVGGALYFGSAEEMTTRWGEQQKENDSVLEACLGVSVVEDRPIWAAAEQCTY